MKQTLSIDQSTYVTKVLKEFSMNKLKAVSTSIDSYKCIKSAMNNKPMADQLKYQKAVKSLMYTMTAT